MKTLIRTLPAFLRLSLATMFQYRGEIVLWAVWGVVYPAVAMAMWSAAVAGSDSGTDIQGFGPRDFAAYFLLTMVVGHICTAWDIYEMGFQIRTGRMSAKLLRPLLPIWERVADNLAYKVLTLSILVPIWFGIALLTHPRIDTTLGHALLTIPAIIQAAVLNFLWHYILALSAFWITRTDAVGELYFGAGLFFGGRLAPIQILPIPLQWIAACLPFKWIVWFPVSALTGKLTTAQIGWGLLWQTGWLLAGIAVFLLVWRAAIKRYSAVGA